MRSLFLIFEQGEYIDASKHQGVEETVYYLCNLNSQENKEHNQLQNGENKESNSQGNATTNGSNNGDTHNNEQEDANLVWRFSSWVLRKNPIQGIFIFTKSKRKYELNSDRVLEFLLSFVVQQEESNSSGGGSGGDNSVLQRDWARQARVTYLDYLISRKGQGVIDVDQHYHTMLALELITMTIYALEHGWKRTDDDAARRKSEHAEDLISRLSNPTPSKIKMDSLKKNHGKFPPIRKKLLNMLRTSTKYNNQQLLTATSGKGLHEERVLLLANAGKHEDALRTLVFHLRDLNEAERYCQEHSPNMQNDPQHTNGLFLPLIKLYLERGENNVAMTLLKRHAPRIDAIQAMSQLPEVATIATMQPFLQNMLRHNTHRRSQAMISKNLAKTLNLNVRCKLAKLESRAVVTAQSTSCCVCHTLIAPNTVFVVFPAGEIAHLKCCREGLDVHPITKEILKHGDRNQAYKWKLRG